MEEKSWWQSKTKLGALIIGVSALLGSVGAYFSGTSDLTSLIQQIIAEVGAVIGIFGLRDLPVVNGKK